MYNQQGLLQVRESQLIFRVELSGIRYWMQHWFWVTAVIGIGFIFGCEIVVVVLSK